MESKSALFAKGTALRAELEARGYEFVDIDVEVPEELKGMSMAQIYESLTTVKEAEEKKRELAKLALKSPTFMKWILNQ